MDLDTHQARRRCTRRVNSSQHRLRRQRHQIPGVFDATLSLLLRAPHPAPAAATGTENQASVHRPASLQPHTRRRTRGRPTDSTAATALTATTATVVTQAPPTRPCSSRNRRATDPLIWRWHSTRPRDSNRYSATAAAPTQIVDEAHYSSRAATHSRLHPHLHLIHLLRPLP